MNAQRLILALGALLMAAPAYAQEGTVKVATCNALKVLEGMQERKAFDAELTKKRQSLENDARRREMEVKQLQKDRDDLNPDSALYQEKNEQLLKMVIESEVYLRTKQQEMARWEKARWRTMFDKVREASKEVSGAKGIDLVLTERRNDMMNFDALNVDQVKLALAQNDVLYSGPKVDITNDVLIAVDKKYVASSTGGK